MVESGDLWWDEDGGSFEDNLCLDRVYESLDEVIAHMEELYGKERKRQSMCDRTACTTG